MNYVVYKHTAPNGKVYIGITKLEPIKRWSNGYGYKHNKHFFNAILKCGWDNFKHEILFAGLSKEEAEQKEMELIAHYKSNDRKYGYNHTNGGHSNAGNTMSVLARQKMSKSHLGKSLTQEHKNNIRSSGLIAHKEEMKPVYRFTKDGKFIDKFPSIRQAMKSTGIADVSIIRVCKHKQKSYNGYIFIYENELKQLDKIIQKAKCIERGNNIYQIDRHGVIVAEYISFAEAGRKTNLNPDCISNCCKGKQKTAGGYIWMFRKD